MNPTDPTLTGELHLVHSGKLGDIIYAIPTMRELSRKHNARIILHLAQEPDPYWVMSAQDVDNIRPLLCELPYIAGVEFHESHEIPDLFKFGQEINPHGMNTFRCLNWEGMNLSQAQLRCFVLSLDAWREPWLNRREESGYFESHVVISRTLRYPVEKFPWKELAARYKDYILFLGQPHEWVQFKRDTGVDLVYWRGWDLREAKEVIGRSNLFIANQGCLSAIADGLGHRHILADYAQGCNWFPRSNKAHVNPSMGDEFPWDWVERAIAIK
jgi:hypothetical protein